MTSKRQPDPHERNCVYSRGFLSGGKRFWIVYVISEIPLPDEPKRELVKIGKTSNPPNWRMFTNLRLGNPRTLVLTAFEFQSKEEMDAAERAAHDHFDSTKDVDKHVLTSEWFRVEFEQAAEFLVREGGTRIRCTCRNPNLPSLP